MREAPGFDWKAYFAALGVPDLAELNVAQPAYAAAFGKLAASQPAADWRAYLRWHVINAAPTKLPPAFEEEHFAFFQRTLTGVQQMPPRNERVIESISGRYEPLAQALGELFVGEASPPEARRRALELVGHVKAALRERLEKLDWMEEATRKAALDKLDQFLSCQPACRIHWTLGPRPPTAVLGGRLRGDDDVWHAVVACNVATTP